IEAPSRYGMCYEITPEQQPAKISLTMIECHCSYFQLFAEGSIHAHCPIDRQACCPCSSRAARHRLGHLHTDPTRLRSWRTTPPAHLRSGDVGNHGSALGTRTGVLHPCTFCRRTDGGTATRLRAWRFRHLAAETQTPGNRA